MMRRHNRLLVAFGYEGQPLAPERLTRGVPPRDHDGATSEYAPSRAGIRHVSLARTTRAH